MTVVTKVIRNTKYLYYQDSISIDNTRKVVSTCIGNAEQTPEQLLISKQNAWQRHLISLLKLQRAIKEVPYHFEDEVDGIGNDQIEFLKLINQLIKKSLTPENKEKFEQNFFVKYVHGTTAIEGNSLTESETKEALVEGTTPQNKKINDAVEVVNYNDVKKLFENWSEGITEELIKKIHKRLMTGTRKSNGDLIRTGEYRINQADINDVWYTPPPPEDVPRLMKYLLGDYHDGLRRKVHPLELACKFHQRFEEIHPFEEGNGRTGRAILNFMLNKYDLPEIYVRVEDRDMYLDTLIEGNVGTFVPLLKFILERMMASINFIVSNTPVFQIIASDEYKKLFLEVTGSEELYNKLMEPLIQYHKTGVIP